MASSCRGESQQVLQAGWPLRFFKPMHIVWYLMEEIPFITLDLKIDLPQNFNLFRWYSKTVSISALFFQVTHTQPWHLVGIFCQNYLNQWHVKAQQKLPTTYQIGEAIRRQEAAKATVTLENAANNDQRRWKTTRGLNPGGFSRSQKSSVGDVFFFVDVLVLNVGGEARKHSWIDGHESWYWYMVSWYNYGHLWYFVDIIWRLRIITPNDHKGIPSTKKCYISLEAILSPVGHRKKNNTITQV